ncbi:MAG: hypothetical protein Kow0031_17530 [Anaerolineae bacterium]
MFNAKSLRQQNFGRGWWLLLAAVGAAFIFYLGQLPASPPEAAVAPETAPTANPAPQAAAETAPDTGYLAEYDPDANPMLAATPTEKQEWELGIDVFVKLALVLALVYLAMLGLRWLKKGKNSGLNGSTTINVLETTGLAPGRSLHLVVVGEKTLLLGATDTHISLLTELPNAALPLPEEAPEFEQVMAAQTTQPEAITPGDDLPPHLKLPAAPTPDDAAAEYVPDWQAALAGMRAGIRSMQNTVGG